MIKYNINDLQRIDKRQARRLYNAGYDVLFLPCNMNPVSLWGMGIWQNLTDWGQYKDFDTLCNWYTWYNCTAETGRYIAFYIKRGAIDEK